MIPKNKINKLIAIKNKRNSPSNSYTVNLKEQNKARGLEFDAQTDFSSLPDNEFIKSSK